MDISLIPLYIYKIPKDCTEIIITSNVMFTKQDTPIMAAAAAAVDVAVPVPNIDQNEAENLEVPPPPSVPLPNPQANAPQSLTTSTVGVVGCSTTILRIGEDSDFNMSSMLGTFSLPNETIIDLHRVPYCLNSYYGQTNADTSPSDLDSNNSYDDGTEKFRRISTESYVRQMRRDSAGAASASAPPDQFEYNDRKIIEHEFPLIEFDKCFVVTDKSLYLIEFK